MVVITREGLSLLGCTCYPICVWAKGFWLYRYHIVPIEICPLKAAIVTKVLLLSRLYIDMAILL